MAEKTQVTTQQKIMIGIIAVVGLFMFYSKAYAPMQGKIKDSRKTLQENHDKLKDMKNTARQLDKLEKELEVLERQLKITEKKLPTDNELPVLIKTITDTAKKYSISITNMKVSGSVNDKFYTAHNYVFSISTDYHTLGSFLASIVQMDRIFNIENVQYRPQKGSENINVDFTIAAYTAK